MSELRLRPVEHSDLDVFFDHQADPEAAAMADFPSRDRQHFDAHRAKIRRDESNVLRTILLDGAVAGGISSWLDDGRRLVGYWIGRDFWAPYGCSTRTVSDASTKGL